MASELNRPTIDTFELARSRARLSGEVEIERMPRLAEALAAPAGAVHYRIEGLIDDDGHPGAVLHLSGRLPLVCQRCNKPLDFVLDQTTRFRFVASEEELNALPLEDDEIDAVVGSHTLDLIEWLEDEVILALPLVPRHEDCSLPFWDDTDAAFDSETNPFRALAALVRDRKS